MTNPEIQKSVKDFYERYLNKKEILFRLSTDINIDDFWPLIHKHRKNLSKEIDLKDQNNEKFWFNINDKIKNQIDYINKVASIDLFNSLPDEISEDIINDILIDEAFNSSVIEGAFSTRQRSQELIKKKLHPANKDEQMIYNNYKALEYVLQNLHRKIDENVILDIYKTVTYNTLDSSNIVEKYRNDRVYVWDEVKQEVVYEAPKYDQVSGLMNKLIDFINCENDGIHPVIKASIIHFYFVYVHPFFDGNGRTARALTFMFLLQNGYSYFKFFSISSIIKEERSKYYKAIKDVEDYNSDLTYFINYLTEMIVKAMNLTWILFKKEFAYKIIKKKLAVENSYIPQRIDKALKYYLKKNIKLVTIEDHQKKYGSSYETARTDLNKLTSLGIFDKTKQGKMFVYKANEIDDILKILDKI